MCYVLLKAVACAAAPRSCPDHKHTLRHEVRKKLRQGIRSAWVAWTCRLRIHANAQACPLKHMRRMLRGMDCTSLTPKGQWVDVHSLVSCATLIGVWKTAGAAKKEHVYPIRGVGSSQSRENMAWDRGEHVKRQRQEHVVDLSLAQRLEHLDVFAAVCLVFTRML